jgi:putative flippase GtrA
VRILEHWRRLPRFARNALISLPTFLFDLVLLVLLVQWLHMAYVAATVAAFIATNVLSYFLARWLVFTESRRGLRSGLVYFLGIATLTAFLLAPLMWLLVDVVHLGYLVSRIAAAAILGIAGYASNLLFHFRITAGPDELLPTRERR